MTTVTRDAIILDFCATLEKLTANLRRDIATISADLELVQTPFESDKDSQGTTQEGARPEVPDNPRAVIQRRTAILVLYSYWESIIKESSERYLTLVESTCADAAGLCSPLRTLHRWTTLKNDGYLNRTSNLALSAHSILLKDNLDENVPSFSRHIVSPNSNLNAERFESICQWLNIDSGQFNIITDIRLPGTTPAKKYSSFLYQGKSITESIDRFVGYRNEVAHSALTKPPSITICSFYRAFIPELISAFIELLQDMAIQHSWMGASAPLT